MPDDPGRNRSLCLQGSVGLLCAGEVAGRKVLAKLGEIPEQGILVSQVFDYGAERRHTDRWTGEGARLSICLSTSR